MILPTAIGAFALLTYAMFDQEHLDGETPRDFLTNCLTIFFCFYGFEAFLISLLDLAF